MSAPTVLSWGRYPNVPQMAHAVHWRDELDDRWHEVLHDAHTTLAYGNGRSYGDSCLASSGHVLSMRGLNRLMWADWQSGVICAEAGVTLDELLRVSIPRGWFVMVTPGTRYVTLGGAVANDVHGKNHHVRGTFGTSVRRLKLRRSDCEPVVCSREDNVELFAATLGGLGLTGVIEWVELQLMPIQSSEMDVTQVRFDSLAAFLSLSDEFEHSHEYAVAWMDCQARGAKAGRGVFIAANHCAQGELKASSGRALGVPWTPPFSLMNRVTTRVLNPVYFHAQATGRATRRQNYDSYFYPLDGIAHWHRLYGRQGFQQYQCVLPMANAEVVLLALLQLITTSGAGSFLSVLKRCGDVPSLGVLSFPMAGVSLALDFTQSTGLAKLFQRMDVLVEQAGGRLYPAKDAHMSGAFFRTSYPRWVELEALRDPALKSWFWQRVTGIE